MLWRILRPRSERVLAPADSSAAQRVSQIAPSFVALLVFSAAPIVKGTPAPALWATPSILLAAMLIAWAAESAQFFIAQAFALAILAWLQTMPEFAVEFVLAWKQRTDLLTANLTGALRLLTGLGWPIIYAVAAFVHRRRTGSPLRRIRLEPQHSVEVVGILPPLLYAGFIWWKASLTLIDASVLVLVYAAYMALLRRMPPESEECIDDLERVPRAIVSADRPVRIALIAAFFIVGGGLIYLAAAPFLGSLMAISGALGVPTFVFVQWVAPLVSEFPEKLSAFYWARTVHRAPMALMNMVSSNINQWTMLVAMLPIVYSLSRGGASVIHLNSQQELELLMTIGQSLIAAAFLVNMELAWWEAGALFGLWGTQFAFSPVPPGPGLFGFIAGRIHLWVTWAYFAWCAAELVRIAVGRRKPEAFHLFAAMWQAHVGCHSTKPR